MPRRVAIVGGGLAGLSAAVHLTVAGVPCALFEKRPYLGGRVSSFRDPATGEVLDNGPHLVAGAYHATRHFLRLLGSENALFFQNRLNVSYFNKQKGWAELKAGRLPTPFHLLSALGKFRFLSLKERAGILKALGVLRRLPESDALDAISLNDWLANRRQIGAARRFFWDVLVLAMLNAPPEAVSLLNFHRVLHRTFFSSKKDARLGWVTESFEQVFARPAETFLVQNGAQIFKNWPVLELKADGKRVQALVGKAGNRTNFDGVIFALPPDQVKRLLYPHWPDFSPAAAAVASPIVTVHIFLNRPLFSSPFVAFVGGTAQWIFNMNAIHRAPEWKGFLYSVVVSAAVREAVQSKSELVEAVLHDLQKIEPNLRTSDVRHSRVVKEMSGTFVFPPGGEKTRPLPETPLKNLLLAGGWTHTGLPDTIESAVLSGEVVAKKWLSR